MGPTTDEVVARASGAARSTLEPAAAPKPAPKVAAKPRRKRGATHA
mgnify:CR=1 FL=1